MPMELGPGDDRDQYARLCDDWMSRIRKIASLSPTGDAFKRTVEATAGTLARDAQNQIVVVSPEKNYSTVVDRSLLGTSDAVTFQRWSSSIDRAKLPTKFEVREGQEFGGDQKLENTLKHLHARQAEESLRTTKMLDLVHDGAPAKDPRLFTMNMQVRRDQSATFETERNRYILDHRAAQRLTEEVHKQEREKTLSQEFNLKFHR